MTDLYSDRGASAERAEAAAIAPGQGPSRLAWKLAKRAELDSPQGGQVRAALTIRGVLFQGWGLTSTEAMQDLARVMDKWGKLL